ncbi:MAG: 2-oxoacid:acceptor oxidoreductase family protein [Spirochaetales bacterium]|nr:2-oxoacid:acceptor oxidoreductase family protein [Spirochaetales bacterium]
MMQSIFMTGLGGQGVITLAKLVSAQASGAGLKVTLFNAKGMAQRGGRVTSEIRLSDDPGSVFGARISAGTADILIGMEIGETINSLSLLKEGGAAILLDHAFVPTTMLLKKETYPSFQQLTDLYSQKTDRVFAVTDAKQPYNMFILGVFSAVAPAIAPELAFLSRAAVEQAITVKLKRALEDNLESFKQGYTHGLSLLQRV